MRSPGRTPRRLAPALFLIVLSLGATAQEHLDTWVGDTAGGAFGVVVGLGDIDGDSVTDLAVGAPSANESRGRLRVISGATGLEIWRRNGDLPGARLGASVAGVPDVNGDGVNDLVLGLPGTAGSGDAGRVQVRSGVDGALVAQISGTQPDGGFGLAVGGLLDVNGDGRGDVLVGAPFEDGPGGVDSGAAYAYSGRDGTLLAVHHGDLPGDQFGCALQGSILAGDGNPEPVVGLCFAGDGNPEPVVGACQAGNGGPGYAKQLSLTDFSETSRHDGLLPGDRFGSSVALAGDLDGDGTLDTLVGAAPRDALGQPSGNGYALALSGDTGATLFSLASGVPDDGFGSSVSALRDVNGDGVDDIAVGAPDSNGNGWSVQGSGSVRIYSGLDGQLLHLIHGEDGSRFGDSLAFAGDLDGDGLADCAVGAPGSGALGTGAVFLFSLARWIDLHGGVPGDEGVPVLAGSGVTSASSTVELSLNNAPADAAVALVSGTALYFDTALGTFTPTPEILVSGLSSDAMGSLTYELLLPVGLPEGSVLYYQFVVEDPSGLNGETRSNAVAGHSY